jgi:hypothetical protein
MEKIGTRVNIVYNSKKQLRYCKMEENNIQDPNLVTDKDNEAMDNPKFIAVIDDLKKGIVFNLNGVNIEEAYLLLMKGWYKYQKQFDEYMKEEANK